VTFLDKIYDAVKEVEFPAVGVCLLHKYSVDGLSPKTLKGDDKVLYEYLAKKLDVKVHLVSIMLHLNRWQGRLTMMSMTTLFIPDLYIRLALQIKNTLKGKGQNPPTPYLTSPL